MYLPCVATLSLGSHTVLDFMQREESIGDPSFSLLLEPRSLFIQRDQVYRQYLHGIAECIADDLSEQRTAAPLLLPASKQYCHDKVRRGTRISLTYRRVAKSIRAPTFLRR
jgi:alkylated DNA repair protein alkB family protein 6